MNTDILELVFQELLKTAGHFPLPSVSTGCSGSLYSITLPFSLALPVFRCSKNRYMGPADTQ